MNALFADPLPIAAPAQWPVLLLLIALVGAALAFAVREKAGLTFAAGLLAWAAIAVVIGTAWRDMGHVSPQFLTASGIAITGFLAWVCAPATAIGERRRSWLGALTLAMTCGAFGATSAPDLLVLTIWLAVIGVSGFVMTLAVAGDNRAVRTLLGVEAIALLLAALALVFLGLAQGAGALAPVGLPPALARAGLILLCAHILLRAGAALFGLATLARPGVVAPELAVGALAAQAYAATLLRSLSAFSPMWPAGFAEGLAICGGAATLAFAFLFVAAKQRGTRLALLGASLFGVVLLIAGAGGPQSETIGELLFVPFAALIVGSSLRRASLPREGGFAFGGAIELGLAVAAFGVAGLPPFSGFWPRLLLLDASIKSGNLGIAATLVAGSLLLAYGLARAGAPAIDTQARPVSLRALEIGAFGVLLGISLAAGLAPGHAIQSSAPASAAFGAATAVSEAR